MNVSVEKSRSLKSTLNARVYAKKLSHINYSYRYARMHLLCAIKLNDCNAAFVQCVMENQIVCWSLDNNKNNNNNVANDNNDGKKRVGPLSNTMKFKQTNM